MSDTRKSETPEQRARRMESLTPRTDVEAEENGLNRVVSADFARQLERELAEARRDAERYRWLRAKYEGADFRYGENERSVLTFTWPHAVMASLDAAIDAAMKS